MFGSIVAGIQLSDAWLHCRAVCSILRLVEAINGADFIPMNEGMFHKAAFEGAPTNWVRHGVARRHRDHRLVIAC